VGKIEGFPDPPEAENPFIRNGGKGGNRTLDPGIMRDMDVLYALCNQLLTMISKLVAGR
jgi:hypothetical protein